ncbi:site-specific DNA-methyltransferase [Leifsonia poae]|uniref:DNA methylase N-4/N-6 domain-containing protein n=1 Tax=Leifsonia poae TaxID=110933 RepID=A0A9W6LYD6_9MICO|nr:site-specific DNA-methyltransferase [Leifsonia poae]GLJ74745.1 hypothetical protein GCM10017584_03180 [Leifsonia poae]
MEVRRRLTIGDNLQSLSTVPDSTVDLVYMDPPFNSGREYDARLGGSNRGAAFTDVWAWNSSHESRLRSLTADGSSQFASTLRAMVEIVGRGGRGAYTLEMAARLFQIHRVLRPTGSIYVHCDPSASHLLRMVMDALFGAQNFRNEIVWQRTHAHSGSRRFGPVHDTILFYTKSNKFTWNQGFAPYSRTYLEKHFTHEDVNGRFQLITCTGPGDRTGTRAHYEWKGVLPPTGRHWAWKIEKMRELEASGLLVHSKTGVPRLKRYANEGSGVRHQDTWSDLPSLSAHSSERVGYDTQKPVHLLERIISASSNPGDVVLDPFVGSGTTAVAAERLSRSWHVMDQGLVAASLTLSRVREENRMAHVALSGHPESLNELERVRTADPSAFAAWTTSVLAARLDRRTTAGTVALGRRRWNPTFLTIVPMSTAANLTTDLGELTGGLLVAGPGYQNLAHQFAQLGTSRLDVVPEAALTSVSVARTGFADHDLRIA